VHWFLSYPRNEHEELGEIDHAPKILCASILAVVSQSQISFHLVTQFSHRFLLS
jgi:hypothetical protein